MKILSKISNEDARELNNTIVEVEACQGLYKEAMKDMLSSPSALKTLIDYYMHSLKIHKSLWKEILIKYIGEDAADSLHPRLRFDPIKQVIFDLECNSCNSCDSQGSCNNG